MYVLIKLMKLSDIQISPIIMQIEDWTGNF